MNEVTGLGAVSVDRDRTVLLEHRQPCRQHPGVWVVERLAGADDVLRTVNRHRNPVGDLSQDVLPLRLRLAVDAHRAVVIGFAGVLGNGVGA